MIEKSFVRKKVKSLTLGEKLRQLREERHMRVYDLSHKINVKDSYIEALEKGQYNKLPTKVYAKGFVRSYARFFGVTEHVLLNLFEREYSVYKNINSRDDEETVNKLPYVPRFVFTPRVIMVGVGFLILGSIGVYLYFGVDNFISSPWLIVESPAQNSVVTQDSILVQGKTRNNSRVFINGQQVFVGMDGSFTESVGLLQGVNIIHVKSANKFDKESAMDVIVDAQYVIEEPEKDVRLFVQTKKETITVSVLADGANVYNGTITTGDSKEFHAAREITITTDNGGGTLVSCDGENFVQLGEGNESIKDRVYDKDTRCDNAPKDDNTDS
jgi:transcriptional regulator with XRE-family HTH domain